MTLNKFFMKSFLFQNLCFNFFFVAVVYYTFLQKYFHCNVVSQSLCETVVVLEIHIKLTCKELFLKSCRRTILQKYVFNVVNKGKPPLMFSLACNLSKMDAQFNDAEKIFLPKKLCNCNQTRSNQIAAKML